MAPTLCFLMILANIFPRKVLRIANLRTCTHIFDIGAGISSVTNRTAMCDLRHKRPRVTLYAYRTGCPVVNSTPLGEEPETKFGALPSPSAWIDRCFTGTSSKKGHRDSPYCLAAQKFLP